MALGASFYLLDTLEAPFYALETLQVCFKCVKKVKRSPKESQAQLCLPDDLPHPCIRGLRSVRPHAAICGCRSDRSFKLSKTRQPLIKYDYVIQLS